MSNVIRRLFQSIDGKCIAFLISIAPLVLLHQISMFDFCIVLYLLLYFRLPISS